MQNANAKELVKTGSAMLEKDFRYYFSITTSKSLYER
jgi:hypothetical protein